MHDQSIPDQSIPRHARHPLPGPITLNLSAGAAHVDVTVEDIDHAEVTLTPTNAGSDAAADLIRRAIVEATDTALRIALPAGNPAAGGVTVVQRGRGGRGTFSSTSVVSGSGTVLVSGGNITMVNGRIITGDGEVTVLDSGTVTVQARLPRGSSLITRVQAGYVTTTGKLRRVRHQGASAGLGVDAADEVSACTASGDVRVDQADNVNAQTASGDIRIGTTTAVQAQTMSGDIVVSRLIGDHTAGTVAARTMSGDIRVTAAGDATGTASSMSGDVTVERLNGNARVTVSADSMSGRTRTF